MFYKFLTVQPRNQVDELIHQFQILDKVESQGGRNRATETWCTKTEDQGFTDDREVRSVDLGYVFFSPSSVFETEFL